MNPSPSASNPISQPKKKQLLPSILPFQDPLLGKLAIRDLNNWVTQEQLSVDLAETRHILQHISSYRSDFAFAEISDINSESTFHSRSSVGSGIKNG